MSTDFTVTGDQIIHAALRGIGALGIGQTLDPDELTNGRQALNMLIKGLMAGPNPIMTMERAWQRERKSITLSAKASYTMKPSGGDVATDIPVKMLSARLKDTDGNETPLDEMSAATYDSLANKSETGTPAAWFYEKGIAVGTLYLDCIPSDTTYTVETTFLRTLNDIDTATDAIELPVEHFRLIKLMLMSDLATEYELPMPQEAKEALVAAREFSNSFGQKDEFFCFEPGRDD